MSSAMKYQRFIDPAGYGINSVIMGQQKSDPVVIDNTRNTDAPTTQAMAERDQVVGQSRAAGGGSDTENDAYLLGGSAKKRGASRALLG